MSDEIRLVMKSVSIFVDVQNVYYTVKQEYGRNFNYKAFWDKVTKGRRVVSAIAYAVARGDERQVSFQNILRKIGFEVKLKPYISRADGSSKGDWDVGIAIDVLDHAAHSDIIVLVSGDGDFALLLNNVSSKFPIECEVYGVPSLTAHALIKEASRFIPIDEKYLLPKI